MPLSEAAVEAVEIEEQLRTQLSNVKVRKTELFAERDGVEAAIKEFDRSHAAAVTAAARAGDPAPEQKGRAELVADKENLDREIETLKAEQRRLQGAITQHRGMNFALLAEVAEEATQDAAGKEAAAKAAYEAWAAARNEAEHLWNGLVSDRNSTSGAGSQRLSGVMGGEGSPASKLFPGIAIRPPGVEPVE